ncbi:hypothetical protein HaLaN_28278, partial [Haematococcus lacustris]
APALKPTSLEAQLDLFFSHLVGLPRAAAALTPPAAVAAGGRASEQLLARPGKDPYKEWWDMADAGFQAPGSARAWAAASSVNHRLVLIQ